MSIQLTLDKTAIAYILDQAGDDFLLKLKENIVEQVVRSKVKSSLNKVDTETIDQVLKSELGTVNWGRFSASDSFKTYLKAEFRIMAKTVMDEIITEQYHHMEAKYKKAMEDYLKSALDMIPSQSQQEIDLLRAIRAYKENQ